MWKVFESHLRSGMMRETKTQHLVPTDVRPVHVEEDSGKLEVNLYKAITLKSNGQSSRRSFVCMFHISVIFAFVFTINWIHSKDRNCVMSPATSHLDLHR